MKDRVAWGAVAGLLAGVPAALLGVGGAMTATEGLLFAGVATVVGVVLAVVVGARPDVLAPAVATGLVLGVLGWVLGYLTAAPLLAGRVPTWSADSAAAGFEELVAGLLHGGLTGAVLVGLGRLRPVRRSEPAPRAAPIRVVIVGGGFAGVATARRLERFVARGQRLAVTLISDSNFLLFTPMLAGAASGAVQARHISAPVRAACPHTGFRRGRVVAVDPALRSVRVATAGDAVEEIGYDQLVVATGAAPHFFGRPDIAARAFTLKTLGDAIRVREHVLATLDRADAEPEPQRRRRLLSFVVVGGGFAGTELIAELFDLVYGVLRYYPGIDPDDPRFTLVHSGARILPELPAELGAYALARLRARGITFRLGARVTGADASVVRLDDGTELPAGTLVWAAGTRPVAPAGLEPGLAVDTSLRVRGQHRIWAVGDCARVPDPDHPGGHFPPTAQHAVRQGTAVADNIVAEINGARPRPFRYRARGVLVALGHRTAVADLRGRRFSGLAAWLLWRGVYLAKLPGLDRKLRVLGDWLLDLAFPRDIVQTEPARGVGMPAGEPAR